MSTDLEDFVNVDYFAVNNIEFTTDFDTSMTSLVDKEYVVVSNSDPDDDTMTEREDGGKLDNNLTNCNINESCNSNHSGGNQPIADETVDTASMTSDGGHSDTATSTQILDLTLSAITKRMDDKLHLKQLKRLKNLDRNIQCHRKYKKYTKLYKWIVLFCSIITFCIYSYYYYQYFHSDKYKQAMYVTPGYNMKNYQVNYDGEEDIDYHGDDDNMNEEREHEKIKESYEYEEYEQYEEYEEYYEYKFQQQHYYHHRYGYYHDYNEQQPSQQQEQYDVISWLWRLILFIISLIICFTSLQIFGVTNPPPKNE